MPADLWKRPSIAVVACAVVVVAVFAARGELGIARGQARPAPVAGGAAAGPVVVRAERAGRPRPDAVHVRGRVSDTAGFLLVGAEVSVPGKAAVRTDADGAFVATVAATETLLLVRAPGHRAQWVVPALGSPDGLFVRLEPAAPWDAEPKMPAVAPPALTGEGIVRGLDGKPLAGAFVTALGAAAWSRTDEIGRYVLPLPSPNPTLVVHHPEASGDGRGQAARSAPLELPRDTGTVPLPEIATSIGSALRGTLRDERGNPVSGVAVQVRGEGLTRVIESGVSGMFRLAGLWPGRYEILPLGHRGSLGRSQQVVVDRPYVDCDVRLQATVERRLQVLDEAGAPVARAHVAATFQGERCAVAQADGDGWAALRVAATDTDFEVHDADELQARPVRRYDGDHGRLVVARP